MLSKLPLHKKKQFVLRTLMLNHLIEEVATIREQPPELVSAAFAEIAKADLDKFSDDEINFIIETNDKLRSGFV